MGGLRAGEHSLSRLTVSEMSFSVSGSTQPPLPPDDPLPLPPSTAFFRMDLLRRCGSGVGHVPVPLPPLPDPPPRSVESADSDDLLPPFLPAAQPNISASVDTPRQVPDGARTVPLLPSNFLTDVFLEIR